jgi:urease accessory protein
MRAYPLRLATLLLLLAPAAVLAHPGHTDSHLMQGLMHPVLGIDHLLAMLAVGIWAAQQSGTFRWAIPAGFLASMFMGAMIATAGLQLPLVELGIVLSVIAFGIAIAFSLRAYAALIAVVAFAVFHGHAHGSEAALSMDVEFVVGMLAATAALHLAGLSVGSFAQRRWQDSAPRWTGASIVLGGLALAVGA